MTRCKRSVGPIVRGTDANLPAEQQDASFLRHSNMKGNFIKHSHDTSPSLRYVSWMDFRGLE